MRRAPTPAEAELWKYLRGRKIAGLKFRRQHPIDRFIVDFYCVEAGLAIEIDGKVHATRTEEDRLRQEFIEERDIRFLRFSNDDVLQHLDSVIARITDVITTSSTRLPLSTDVERGPGGEV
jgi:very-short-patch-repair endonuclease